MENGDQSDLRSSGADGSVIVVPSLAGGTTLLDVNDGHVLTGASTTDSPLGALAEIDGGWIAFNRQTIAFLPQLGGLANIDCERIETGSQ